MRNIGIEFPEQGRAGLFDLGTPPSPGPKEILIRTLFSGVTNGTERHAMMAELGWKQFPGRHGYQHVGVVEQKGAEVDSFELGDTLFFGRYVGHRGWNVQEVGKADPHAYHSHLCLPLPKDTDIENCALFGVAGVAMRAVRRCRVAHGHRVWVVGAGLIGQFAAQAAKAFGAYVTITDPIEKRLEAARQVGIHQTFNTLDDKLYETLKAGGAYDRIIDASGYPPLLSDIQKHSLLAYRGVIGLIAARTDTTFPWSMLHGREASLEVSCHFSLDDLKTVLHFFRRGEIQIAPLVFHRAPITDAPKLYEMLRDRRDEMLGIIFDWREGQ